MVDQRAIVITHGVLACLAWVVFFPLGSVLVRVLNGPATWKIHAAIQIFALLIFTAAVGTGLQMAVRFRVLDNYHIIIGLLLFCFMFIQVVSGFLHHVMFKAYRHRTIVTYIHLWIGRILITLGMINGGLGLYVNGRSTRAENIAYGTIAALFWCGWLATSAIYSARRGERSDVPEMSPKERRQHARERRIVEREARIRLAQKQRDLEEKEDSS